MATVANTKTPKAKRKDPSKKPAHNFPLERPRFTGAAPSGVTDITINGGIAYRRGKFKGFAGDLPFVKVSDSAVEAFWEGPKLHLSGIIKIGKGKESLALGGWREAVGFFASQYKKKSCERMGTFYVNWDTDVVGFYPHNQKSQTMMTTDELENDELRHLRETLLNDHGWWQIGTLHHHCASAAGQSSTDHGDEEHKHGVHITLGKLTSDLMDFDVRFVINVPGEFGKGNKPNRAAVMAQYSKAPLSAFVETPDVEAIAKASKLDEESCASIAKAVMLKPIVAAYPEEWDENIMDGITMKFKDTPTPAVTGKRDGGARNMGVSGANASAALIEKAARANSIVRRPAQIDPEDTSVDVRIPCPNPNRTDSNIYLAADTCKKLLDVEDGMAHLDESIKILAEEVEKQGIKERGSKVRNGLASLRGYALAYKDPDQWQEHFIGLSSPVRLVMWRYQLTPKELSDRVDTIIKKKGSRK